jgi:4-hydroxy 2-oxovalerate aldolase
MTWLLDTTLRDGSHAVHHSFTAAQVERVVRALDAAGVTAIEVSHGDGLGGSSLQCGFSAEPEESLIASAVAAAGRARIAVMSLPGMGAAERIRRAVEAGAAIVRVAVLCMQAELAEAHLAAARAAGAEAVGFLMASHMRGPAELARQARTLESAGAGCVYLADSAGAMLPGDAAARVAAVREAVGVEVGFHSHNNFGAAIANSIAALDAGATWIDGSLRGLGAGAGNAATELLGVVLERRRERTHPDVPSLLDAAEFEVAPMMQAQPFPDRDSVHVGRVGIYSTFLAYARRAAAAYELDPAEIVLELGRRQAVVGQEDLVVEIAEELAAR